MNICFLTTDAVNPKNGGIERVTNALAEGLFAEGDEVCFCAMYRHDEDVFDSEKQFFFPNRNVYGQDNAAFWKNFLEEKKIDVVIYQGGGSKKIPFPEITKKTGAHLIVAFHSKPDYFRSAVPALLAQKYGLHPNATMPMRIRIKAHLRIRSFVSTYRFNAKHADRIVLLSESYRKEMLDIVGNRHKDKLFAIPNPCPIEAEVENSELENKTNTILFVGRMSFDDKRPDRLLDIWAKLEKRVPDWSVKFVGDGEYLPELKEQARRLNLERVSFEGFRDPVPYYREAAIFCLTSTYEGFPIGMVEAASFGCVLIAFESYSAAKDIVDDGETGFLVPAFDSDIYARRLETLVTDPELRLRMSKKALARIPEKFSLKKITASWKSLFPQARQVSSDR